MSDIKQELLFLNSGMDTDSDERFIAPGDSPYRLHVMISGNEAMGVLTNMLGNELTIDISDHKLILSQTYNTVASYYNKLTRKAYYWVFGGTYDSGGGVFLYDNRLLCYNEDIGTLDLIFIDTKNWFGLSLTSLFKDSAMIADWLYFNPKISEPKMIDVVRAYNYTNYVTYSTASTFVYGDKMTFYGGLFVALSTVSAGQSPITHPEKWNRIGDSYRDETDLAAFSSEFEYAFNVIKMPPIERPVVTYQNDTQINVNNIRGKLFRFSYRYKYFDNSYSKYSSYSDITLPEDDEVYNGEILNKTTTNNYIKIAINPHSPALVKEIEIVVLESSSAIAATPGTTTTAATESIPADWKRIKVINRQEQAELTTFDMSFNFYNNESYIEVTDIEVATIEDYVPQRANSMEIINKNILGYGGCLEGHNNIPKDEIRVSLTPVLQSLNTIPTIGTIRRNNITSGDISNTDRTDPDSGNGQYGKQIDQSWLLGSIVNTDWYVVTIKGRKEALQITVPEAADKYVLLEDLRVFLQAYYPDLSIEVLGTAMNIWSQPGDVHYPDVTQSLFCAGSASDGVFSKKRGFKTGANQPFCLYYYDGNMRRWDAQVSKDNIHIFGLQMRGTTVYVPQFNEVSPLPDSTAYKWIIDWEVYHLPPEGAKYWRWGYAGNSLETSFVQYIISSVADSDPTTDGANMTKIDITPLQTLKTTTEATWNQFPTSIIDSYTMTAGDRIRFITKQSVAVTVGDFIDGVYEYEILKQDTTANTLFIQGLKANNGIDAAGVGINSLVEIYSPIKSISDTQTVYYEFGDIMPIIKDSAGIMVHAGQNGLHNQDTALSHSAMGTFDGGDIYHIMRTPSKPIDTVLTTKGFFHESMFYSDFYNSDDWDKGKIGFETTFGQRFLNIVRYSRPYFQDTEINGLPTFEEDDANGWAGYKEYNDIFGDIIAICEFGDTLKVYQERKPSSTLVGRTEYMDSQGEVNVAISTVVLGAIRYDKSNYSTVLSESISRNNDFIYGFDIYNGVAWRDGNNGIFPISGRYATAENNNDYKMQTYFKLKAKALMESGIDHVSVLTVWDEEYKLVYFVFKDSVVQANNETIVFHQPSNRWITFVDLQQTPLSGFNTPLVPSPYTILKGFENGIGYSFNEETGFGTFNIGSGGGTTALTSIYPGAMGLVITMPTPNISCSPNAYPGDIGMQLSVNSPSLVHVSYITLYNANMGWTAAQYGISNGVTCGIALVGDGNGVGDGNAWLDSFPSWITVAKTATGPLSVNSPIYDGDSLIVYPTQVNTSVQKSGIITIKDSFGNLRTINVIQAMSAVDPTVIVSVNPYQDPTGLILYAGVSYGTAQIGSDIVDVTFTVHNPTKVAGQPYTLYYYITRNSILDNSGQFDIRDQISTNETVLLTSTAVPTESIIVFLSGIPYGITHQDATIYAMPEYIVITMPQPTVVVSWITILSASHSWDAYSSGRTAQQNSTAILTGSPTAIILSAPNWVTLIDAVIGSPLTIGGPIPSGVGGSVIGIYPIATNGSTERADNIIIQDTYGNQGIISVLQTGSHDNANVLIKMNPSFPSNVSVANTRGTSTIGDPNISITFVPVDPSLGYLASLTLHYQIWKNTSNVGMGDLVGLVNMGSNTKLLTMSSPANSGDTITVYLNK